MLFMHGKLDDMHQGMTEDLLNFPQRLVKRPLPSHKLVESTALGREIYTSRELMMCLLKKHQAGSQDVSVVAR